VQEPKQIDPRTKGLRVIGLDMDLVDGYVDSTGNTPGYVQLYRAYEQKLAELQE
jgi:hypothetical protein